MKNKILVIDDQPDIRMSARFLLSEHGYDVHEAENLQVAMFMLKKQKFEIVLLDMNYSGDTTSGREGINFLKQLQQEGVLTNVIAMTAWSSVELAVEALQNGAKDFIEKPWDNQRLLQIIKQQNTIATLEKENSRLKQVQSIQSKHEAELTSPKMTMLFNNIDKIAIADASVLLTGENGTGKSSIARYIHRNSSRSDRTFVSVNMGAIPESLFESELFGHKKGAFTDAKSDRLGRFELAEGGTLFLDEIANLSLDQQAKLLRVLEEGEFEMVGDSTTKLADVRLICATNANLEQKIIDGKFRADLFFRLNTVPIHIPSLRERREDIKPLLDHFVEINVKKYGKPDMKFSDGALRALTQYDWPGNLRELSHLVERCVLLGEGELIDESDIDLRTTLSALIEPQSSKQAGGLQLMSLEQAEKQLISMALKKTMGNIIESAKVLGISQSSMYRRMEKFGINKFDLSE